MILLLILMIINLNSEEILPEFDYEGPYTNGKLELGLLTFANSYWGEFDSQLGTSIGIQTKYTLPNFPEISFGARYLYGNIAFQRHNDPRYEIFYNETFPEEHYNQIENTSTKIQSLELLTFVNLFPRSYLNYYVFMGGGLLRFQPKDITNAPRNEYNTRALFQDFKDENEFQGYFIGGLGADFYVNRKFSIGIQSSFRFTDTDMLDAFELSPLGKKTASDYYVDYGLKFSYYIFENSDIDGDGMSNEREIELGLNPYRDDTDADGLTDIEETQQYKSNPKSKDSDGDGLSDLEEVRYRTDLNNPDTDDDGLYDFDEIFVHHSNPLLNDSDEDEFDDYTEIRLGLTVNNADTDGDKIIDGRDQCPSVFGLSNNNGCPEIKTIYNEITVLDTVQVSYDTLIVVQEVRIHDDPNVIRPSGIFFRKNSDVLLIESELQLDQIALWLESNNKIIEIQGHTDGDGSKDFNMDLSKRRALKVKSYLVSRGIPDSRLITKGFGFEKPLDLSKTSKAKAKNRRIEFIILDDYSIK